MYQTKTPFCKRIFNSGCFTILETKKIGHKSRTTNDIEFWKLHLLKGKRENFKIYNYIVSNMNEKCQEEPWSTRFRCPPIQLKTLFNETCRAVVNACTFLLSDRLNLLRNVFKVLDQRENLTPVWKCVEMELSSVSCLNNFERISFVICRHTKDLLYQSKHDFSIVG